jgi:hypothetical protein
VTNPSDDGTPAAPAQPAKNSSKSGGGRFPKGKSANPAGRKRGSRNRSSLWLEGISEDDRAIILAKIVKQARSGCRASQKLIADRINPPRRGRIAIDLGPIKTSADALEAMSRIVVATGKGDISPNEAMELSAVVDEARKAIESIDHEARLVAIEARMGWTEDAKL